MSSTTAAALPNSTTTSRRERALGASASTISSGTVLTAPAMPDQRPSEERPAARAGPLPDEQRRDRGQDRDRVDLGRVARDGDEHRARARRVAGGGQPVPGIDPPLEPLPHQPGQRRRRRRSPGRRIRWPKPPVSSATPLSQRDERQEPGRVGPVVAHRRIDDRVQVQRVCAERRPDQAEGVDVVGQPPRRPGKSRQAHAMPAPIIVHSDPRRRGRRPAPGGDRRSVMATIMARGAAARTRPAASPRAGPANSRFIRSGLDPPQRVVGEQHLEGRVVGQKRLQQVLLLPVDVVALVEDPRIGERAEDVVEVDDDAHGRARAAPRARAGSTSPPGRTAWLVSTNSTSPGPSASKHSRGRVGGRLDAQLDRVPEPSEQRRGVGIDDLVRGARPGLRVAAERLLDEQRREPRPEFEHAARGVGADHRVEDLGVERSVPGVVEVRGHGSRAVATRQQGRRVHRRAELVEERPQPLVDQPQLALEVELEPGHRVRAFPVAGGQRLEIDDRAVEVRPDDIEAEARGGPRGAADCAPRGSVARGSGLARRRRLSRRARSAARWRP